MERLSRAAAMACCALVAACGGGGGGGGNSCSATGHKQFVLDVTRDWYLFPELLPATVDVADYPDAQALLDALTATARAQGKDRFFSHLTTPAADSSFLQEGQFIGFGFRTRIEGDRLFLPDVFEQSPAADGGLVRGAEVTHVDSGSGFVPMATILAADPDLEQAFGPPDTGVQRGLRVVLPGGATADVVLTKRVVTIQPIPAGGVAILSLPSNPAVPVGYVALRSFISTAEQPLRAAFQQFQDQGIQYVIVDFRYNGGGLVSVANFVGDLQGGAQSANDIWSFQRFNASRSANDVVRRFSPQPQSVAPARVAFITTGSTASASELVVNSLKPWVEVAIVGSDTFGKPVGQSAFDLGGCDLRLRLVSFRTTNVDSEGDYYDGLASTLPFACAASDELTAAPGSPDEDSTDAALQWLGTGACGQVMQARIAAPRLLAPKRVPRPRAPSPAQLWLPGLF